MTTTLDIVNRALQSMGSRTTVASLTEQSNEAIQANLVMFNLRDELIRMAPWDCATNFANLNYITSIPGTPENTGPGTITWNKGLPPPPWTYEYQYPADCQRALWVIPAYNTGFTGIPLTSAVTNMTSQLWQGPPMKFKVALDQFFTIGNVTGIVNPGTGYAVGDLIYLSPGLYGPTNIPTASPPIGAAGILQVTNIGPGGTILGASVVPVMSQAQPENTTALTGSYFQVPAVFQTQGTTSGAGTGAAFNVTPVATAIDQRVILTNQQFAILCYLKQVTTPDTMDELFQSAWVEILAARLVFQLTGDKTLANLKVNSANRIIEQARAADGNEGLTVNDVTPDWMRARGLAPMWGGPNWEFSPNMGFAWGSAFNAY